MPPAPGSRLLPLHDPDITVLSRGRVYDSVAVDPPSATRWPGSRAVEREEQTGSFPIQGDRPERGIAILIDTAGQDRSAIRAPQRLIAEHAAGSDGVCHQARRARVRP